MLTLARKVDLIAWLFRRLDLPGHKTGRFGNHTAIYGSQKQDGSTPTPRARQHFTARWPLSKLTTLLLTSEPTPMLDPFALPDLLYW